jgi:hypothetical protein
MGVSTLERSWESCIVWDSKKCLKKPPARSPRRALSGGGGGKDQGLEGCSHVLGSSISQISDLKFEI